MKLSDLNKITFKDIKSIDWKALQVHLTSNPWPIYCLLGAIAAFMSVSHALETHKQTKIARKTEIHDLQLKAKASQDFELVQDQYKNFWATAPDTITESDLVEMLSEIAVKYNVQIVSFSPAKQENHRNINLTSIEITIASKNFTNVVRFMHDVENSPYSIRVGKWNGTLIAPSSPRRRGFRDRSQAPVLKQKYIEASIEIQIVEFKNE